ncbi:helix-turn-helix transcriptional regulator [Methylophaga sp. OBS3]|uniref:helix-turn-helix transcriptional regulator n=1 Tax=Methylophaga sp. OBS3 TaxID=2991934 RepID=UPI002257CB3E|nr:WYL domain-containing protein [Methylophaga sp. OBS3]MCX4190817.1 WYL domain-containing protein [Methylophaga sp. OBS3]
MSDTSLRYLYMLQSIPRHPNSVSTLELKEKLADAGFEINLRSIQRDLEKLSVNYPLFCEEQIRPYRWSYSADASVQFLPALDLPSAITLELARAYLQPLLPPKLLNHLKPHFDESQAVLRRNGNPISHWPEKIRFLSRGLIGKRPEIEAEHLEILAEAILNNEKCLAIYQARKWKEKEEIIISPLGLVFRDPNTYLIAKVDGKDNIRQLALHRFSLVEKIQQSFVDSFDIDDFIDSGEMHILHSNKQVHLELICDKPDMNHLLETPLDISQTITHEKDDKFHLSVTLPDTTDLRWWLIAQSAHLKVVEPIWLKSEVITLLEKGLNKQK